MTIYWIWNKNFGKFYLGISLLSMFTFGVTWSSEPGFCLDIGPLEIEILWGSK